MALGNARIWINGVEVSVVLQEVAVCAEWTRPPEPGQPPRRIEIDEAYLSEWIAFGFAEIVVYLAKHAAFDAYYQRRDQA